MIYAPVCHHGLPRETLIQQLDMVIIGNLARRDYNSHRIGQRVDRNFWFGRQSATLVANFQIAGFLGIGGMLVDASNSACNSLLNQSLNRSRPKSFPSSPN